MFREEVQAEEEVVTVLLHAQVRSKQAMAMRWWPVKNCRLTAACAVLASVACTGSKVAAAAQVVEEGGEG
jgi:mRNA-degrading endonuclease toxin of MazEF toxin-antitoxin module